jgi:hypothetical protein
MAELPTGPLPFDEPLWALPPFQKLMTDPSTCIQLNLNLEWTWDQCGVCVQMEC